MNLGTGAARPSDVEWDVATEPAGVAPSLLAPLKWALFNHGVDLMNTGGMTSSAHTDEDIDATIAAFSAALEDLQPRDFSTRRNNAVITTFARRSLSSREALQRSALTE